MQRRIGTLRPSMVRPALLAAVPLVLAMAGPGCGRSRDEPTPAGRAPKPAGAGAARAATALDTDLPAQMPPALEIELRRRDGSGDDTVLKLTPEGARYGVARGKARVALRFVVDPADLEPVWQTLREASFDRIRTEPTQSATKEGTSMRVTAGPARYSASTLGRNAPLPDQAEAYARCVSATEAMLPSERGDTTVVIHWDASVEDRAAALDIEAGDALLGLHRIAGPRPDAELHLSEPRPVTMLLRHGTPATSTSMTLRAGRDHGVEIAYDPEQEALVLRPLAAPPR